jgi:hypothetical protein
MSASTIEAKEREVRVGTAQMLVLRGLVPNSPSGEVDQIASQIWNSLFEGELYTSVARFGDGTAGLVLGQVTSKRPDKPYDTLSEAEIEAKELRDRHLDYSIPLGEYKQWYSEKPIQTKQFPPQYSRESIDKHMNPTIAEWLNADWHRRRFVKQAVTEIEGPTGTSKDFGALLETRDRLNSESRTRELTSEEKEKLKKINDHFLPFIFNRHGGVQEVLTAWEAATDKRRGYKAALKFAQTPPNHQI